MKLPLRKPDFYFFSLLMGKSFPDREISTSPDQEVFPDQEINSFPNREIFLHWENFSRLVNCPELILN